MYDHTILWYLVTDRLSHYFFFSDEIGFCYVIAIAVLNGISPIILELASELSFPISEDIVAGVINQANNIGELY